MSLDQIKQCEHCNKSTLSLLLLRPSPIPRAAPLLIPGSEALSDAGAHAAGLLPSRSPTESRSVLRLLRAGFVHVYIPNPPPPLRQWHVYQVTENADLVPHTNMAFNPTVPADACARKEHNALGMRLLSLPHAHKLSTIWIAYSPNLWSDAIKARNAANPRAMQAVALSGGSPNTFKPTAEALRSHVLECALPQVRIDGQAAIDFAFHTLSGDQAVPALARTLETAAAGHPLTKGKELAVVLRDPSGYARELNHLRVRRHEHAARDVTAKHEHPLTSIVLLDGLRRSIVDDVAMKQFDAIAPVMSEGAFRDVMRVKPNARGWPEGTQWRPLTHGDDIRVYGRHAGRVYYPDHAERAARWGLQQTAATYSRYGDQIDEGKLRAWLKSFADRFRAEHTQAIERLEHDWWAATQCASMDALWTLHFDENDPNDPRELYSPGAVYSCEAFGVFAPHPYVHGAVLDAYAESIRRPVSDPTAVMQRALLANQASLFSIGDYITDQRPDKLHDWVSGLVKEGIAALQSMAPGPLRSSFSWLLHGGYAAATLGISSAMSAAVAAVAAGSGTGTSGAAAAGALAPRVLELADRVQAWLMASKAVALARRSVKTQAPLRVPMMMGIELEVMQALRLVHPGAAIDADAIAQASRGGKVTLYLVTDNLELARFGLDPRRVLAAGTLTVTLSAPSAVALGTAALTLGEAQIGAMFRGSAAKVDQAAAAVKEVMVTGRGAFLSLDGHIGLLAVLLNGWGLLKTLRDPKWKDDWLAFFNVLDSAFSMIAGSALIVEAATAANITHRVGEKVAQSAASVLGVRAVAAVAGAVASGATFAGQAINAMRATSAGDEAAFVTYGLSATSFLGLTASQGITASGAVAKFMISLGSKRGIWSLTVSGVDALGARLVARTAFGLTGWGLVFLGVGIAFDAVAIFVSPDALQKHLRRSYFGVGDQGDKYKTLAEEMQGLEMKKPELPAPVIPPSMDIVAP